MRSIEITVLLPDDLHELLIAEMADLDFNGFVQEDGVLKAYIPASKWDDTRREGLELWLNSMGFPQLVSEQFIEPRNWNRQWEETIGPVAVGPFLVKPTWAEIPPEHRDLMLLEIDPKMSFGTGYHPSTRLILRLLPRYIESGQRVLDAGTGTGILAIAALRLGARHALCFDTDEWAQANCIENFYLNGIQGAAEFRAGSLEAIRETGFDIILANIERNVLLGMMAHFESKLASGGHLLMSGFLVTDRELVLANAEEHALRLTAEDTENEWWAVAMQKDA